MNFDSQLLFSKLRELVAIDCSPGNGTQEFAKYVFNYCQKENLDCRVHEDIIAGQHECSVMIGDFVANPKFLLQAHIDSNDPGNYASWERNLKNPFSATLQDGEMYGLGIADAKADFLAKLIAMSTEKKTKKKSSTLLIGSFDGLGIMSGALKTIRRYNLRPNFTLIGAPTSGTFHSSSPGQLLIRLVVPFDEEEIIYREQHDLELNTSSQSKLFSSQGNAIKEMLGYLSQLPSGLALIDIQGGDSPINLPRSASVEIDLVGTLKNPITQKLIFWLESLARLEKKMASKSLGNVINLGMISCSAEHVEMQASVALTSSISTETYQNTLEELKALSEKSGCRIEFVDMKKPYSKSLNLEGLAGGSLKVSKEEFRWCNEASLFGRISERCVIYGPGHKSNKGTDPFEHVRVDDLIDTTELYIRILKEEII